MDRLVPWVTMIQGWEPAQNVADPVLSPPRGNAPPPAAGKPASKPSQAKLAKPAPSFASRLA
eukprot:22780-Prorocentrum_minimum.AAC.1